MRRIKISYGVVTPESAENGDYEETGWENEEGIEIEPDEDETIVDLAVREILDKGPVEPSSSRFSENIWYTTYGDTDYTTGAETTYSFHLEGFSELEQQQIYWKIIGRTG